MTRSSRAPTAVAASYAGPVTGHGPAGSGSSGSGSLPRSRVHGAAGTVGFVGGARVSGGQHAAKPATCGDAIEAPSRPPYSRRTSGGTGTTTTVNRRRPKVPVSRVARRRHTGMRDRSIADADPIRPRSSSPKEVAEPRPPPPHQVHGVCAPLAHRPVGHWRASMGHRISRRSS